MNKSTDIKKILQLINEGSVTTQDLQSFVSQTLDFVKKNRDDFLQISQENIAEMDKIVAYIDKEHEKVVSTVEEKTSKIEKNFQKNIEEVKQLLEGARNLIPLDGKDGRDGKDGKDGSPDTPEEIVKKINTTENSIDAKVIKDSATYVRKNDLDYAVSVLENQTRFLIASNSNRGSSTSGVASVNGLTGAVTLSAGSGIFFDTTGNDIAINAIGSTVPSDTSLAVKVATTAVLPGTPTYDNGTSGVGATLTRSSNGTTGTIDGVIAANLIAGDYILVKNQAAQLQNGVYEVTQQGTASLPYILTRVTEADTTAEMDDLVVTAAQGTANKGVPYGQQTNNPTIGVSNIVFTATGIYMRQQTTGTQAINQIPVYTGTALTQTKGTANFKYNPTNDLFTIRGIDYTFPANNGDASQVLTTDGSGTLSWESAGGGLQSIKVTVPAADMLAVVNGHTPYELIPTPGSGKMIVPITIRFRVNFNTTAYNFNATLRIGTNTTGSTTTGTDGGQLTATNLNTGSTNIFVSGSAAGNTNENTALYLNAGTATTVTQGDSDVDIYILYKIMTL